MDYTISYEKDIQTKLDRNEKLLRAKTEQIADLQYEAELIANASIGIIRGIPDHVQMTDLHKIWLDFDNDGTLHTIHPNYNGGVRPFCILKSCCEVKR